MTKYFYKAINELGDTVSGTLESESKEKATELISDYGFIPSFVVEESKRSGGFDLDAVKEKFTRIKFQELILFTKQFRTMIRSGVPIINLLQVLENQTENIKLKRTISKISLDVRAGSSLYESISKYPNIFSGLYCNMIRAGEMSGVLAEVMDKLIYVLEHENKIKSDIRSALQYPFTVLIFLGVAFFILLTFAVPRFVSIFLKAGIELPLPTRVCMILYQFLTSYWYVIIGLTVAIILSLYFYIRTERGLYHKDTLILRFPVMGSLFVKAAMSRFASIFAILYDSGIPILESINILSTTIGNSAISYEFGKIREGVKGGRGIAVPLKSARFFPPMVVDMVAIGESAGRLSEMLRDISSHYDEEVDYAVKRLSDSIAPVLTVGLAVIVGFFALAIFLPMWDLSKLAM
ncbi:type II secretion system F family protein [Thermodesulfobacteriota bacterium]